jgi:hypothetical protein
VERLTAEESLKTKKAREKLKQKLEQMQERMTEQALERKSIEIHRWIARHASNRAILKEKTISLFDENNNTAEVSQKISNLAKSLVPLKN